MPVENSLCINGLWYQRESLVNEVEKTLTGGVLPKRLAASAVEPLAFYAGLAYCVSNNCSFLALPSGWNSEQIERTLARFPVTGVLRGGVGQKFVWEEKSTEDHNESPGVFFFTSGTTGEPKVVFHKWKSMVAPGDFAAKKLRQAVWYQAYEPAGYAGFQVYFSSMSSHGQLVIPSKRDSFDQHAEALCHYGVEIVSATPTWWRLLLAGWPGKLPFPALLQATMGGEVVDQTTLDLVAETFKPQFLTHIYASSEAGSTIIVSDRMAGFPATLLGKSGAVQIKVVDNSLWVKSPFAKGDLAGLENGGGEWLDTGDLVEKHGDRYYFCGRKDNQLNIGGAKVSPEEVELQLLGIADIQDCHVYGKKNPILGTVLVADVLIKDNANLSSSDIRDYLLPRLEKHKLPQYIRFVSSIGVSANGKKVRQ